MTGCEADDVAVEWSLPHCKSSCGVSKKFSTLFTSISYNSAKNIARRESIQSVLKSSSFKMKEDFHIRWLSFEGAVDAVIYEDIYSLLSIFLEEVC